MDLDLRKIKDVVWLQTGFLGDIVINTGAMAVLAHHRPQIRQHLITTKVGAAALHDHSLLSSLHVFDKSNKSFWAAASEVKSSLSGQIGDDPTTILLQPHRSFRSGFLALMLRIPQVVFEETDFTWRPLMKVPRVAVLHAAQRDALLLSSLGLTREQQLAAKPVLDPLIIEKEEWKDFFSGDDRIIGSAPGSVWGTKRWLPEYYGDLIKRASLLPHTKFVFLGGQAERTVMDIVAKSLPAECEFLDLVGHTSLDDLRRIYPHLDVLISNDSSAIHYASGFDVPTLAIFGATVSQMGFGPLAKQSVVCELDALECRPCSDHGPMECPLGHFKCMRDLSVEAVYSKLQDLLHCVP